MADTTKIEWADATFNPWIGCTRVSPACDHCYAAASTPARAQGVQWGAGHPRRRTSPSNWKLPLRWNRQRFMECGACGWRGECAAELIGCGNCGSSDAMNDARRRVFCASLADVFDNEVDQQWRIDLLQLIADTPNLDWLLLTKRIGNAHRLLDEALDVMSHGLTRWEDAPWPNVWLGATIANQTEADRDVIKLLRTPAAVRFVSIEPLLGPMRLWKLGEGDFEEDPLGAEVYALSGTRAIPDFDWKSTKLDWVIVGGESGPGARPMHPDWVRSLRDQCAYDRVPFLFKQWGEWAPIDSWEPWDRKPQIALRADGSRMPDEEWHSDGQRLKRIGKAAAGRLLDGREHSEFPAVPYA